MTPAEALDVLMGDSLALPRHALRTEAVAVLRQLVEGAPEIECPSCGERSPTGEETELTRLREIEGAARDAWAEYEARMLSGETMRILGGLLEGP